MANEVEILTENEAGTGWVDNVPSAVSTGYQAQNSNIEANRNGIDASFIRYESGTDDIIIDPSGPIDVNGLPFAVKAQITIANPGIGTYYFRVVPGASDTEKSIELTTDKGTWSAAKNGLYDGDNRRVLNWVFSNDIIGINVVKLLPLVTGIVNSFGQFVGFDNIVLFPGDDFSESFASPSSNQRGLTYDSSTGNLISCDVGTNRIYIHDGISSSVLSNFASPASDPIGLTYDSSTGNLISCDAGTNRIYIHDGISSSVLSNFASPASDQRGLTYDSSTGNLISCDSGTNRIYIHDGISSSVLSNFASPASSPFGLTYDSSTGNLISCDIVTNRIYIHVKQLVYIE